MKVHDLIKALLLKDPNAEVYTLDVESVTGIVVSDDDREAGLNRVYVCTEEATNV